MTKDIAKSKYSPLYMITKLLNAFLRDSITSFILTPVKRNLPLIFQFALPMFQLRFQLNITETESYTDCGPPL